MAGNSAWNHAVKTAFKMGRKTSKSYSLKDAMFDAKKIYKKGKNAVVNLGHQTRRRASPKKGYYRRRTHRGGNAASTTTPKSMLSSLKMNGGENATLSTLPKMKGGKLHELSPSNVTN